MNDDQLRLVVNSLVGISEVSGFSLTDILEELTGLIFSEEEVSQIIEYTKTI